MLLRRTATVALALCLPLVASACGGEGGQKGRPTAGEISKGLGKSLGSTGLGGAVIDCVAQKAQASTMSDAALRSLAEGKAAMGTGNDEKAYEKILTDAYQSCATAGGQ